MEFQLTGKHFNPTCLIVVADWDMYQENLCEEQNRRLSHDVRKGAANSTVKPNKEEKARIDRIIQAVNSTQLSSSDMDFLYRFRYSLTENKKALIKFLYVINWDEENEVNELPILLALWRDRSPIDVADALKLLSKDKSFEHPFVREYAVETLRSASDEELLTFLLQLVQALRYEPATNTTTTATPVSTPATVHVVTKGLTDLAVREGRVPEAVAIPSSMSTTTTASNIPSTSTSEKNTRDELSPLANFLIERACRSPSVANYLFWYLKVEVEDDNNDGSAELYERINASFYTTLANYNEDTRLWIRRLRTVDSYYHEILSIQNKAKQEGKRRDGKELIFKQLLEKNNLSIVPEFDWVPLPLDPKARISGLKIQTVNMFASAVYPVVVEFEDYDNKCKIQEVMKKQQQQMLSSSDVSTSGSLTTTTSTTASSSAVMKSSKGGNTTAASTAPTNTSGIKEITHKIIFKSGDDLRQDQLIMQMISLMDSLLKKVNLDLKLVIYGILAVTKKDGIMEFVRNSMPISAVLKNHGSILEYLRLYNYDKSGPFEISPTAMDTYIKSCAGSCVITYILGIGDRHLDNIMLTRSGELFHIDFGFIFGQDPKPFPPPFRFTRSMADAMGGEDSEHYARFKTYCCQSYNWLRKSANLILNLLSLMGDAGINDISKRSDLSKVLLKVEEKFRPDLTDEQAEQYFLTLISESLHSLAPKLMEVAHKIAVSLR